MAILRANHGTTASRRAQVGAGDAGADKAPKISLAAQNTVGYSGRSIIPDDEDGGTPAELFWGLRASKYWSWFIVNTCVEYIHVGSTSCALWRCFQILAMINHREVQCAALLRCAAQCRHRRTHTRTQFVAQLCYLRCGALVLVHTHIVVELHV